jgi:AcrR family transcriptional regulator
MIRSKSPSRPRRRRSIAARPAAAPSRKRRTLSELAGEARAAIFRAAADVVGRYGYADASISRITERAGIAQGTFYLYFESRQALFDQLLPHVGDDMIRFIRDRVAGARDFYEMEERGFRAFFEYQRRNTAFFTILNQAEVVAPAAYEEHFALLTKHYVRALKRSVDRGEITRYAERELEVVAYMLMAARNYLYLRYVKHGSRSGELPSWVVDCYMRIVRSGVH